MNRLLLTVLILSVPFLVHAQDTIRIVSEQRVIIPIEINGGIEYILVDTGSTLNIIDSKAVNRLKLKKGFLIGDLNSKYSRDALYSLNNCTALIASDEYRQFGTSDISSAVTAILEETGIEISGIIGTPAIISLGMIIDLKRGIITINK